MIDDLVQGGVPHPNGMNAEPLPGFLQQACFVDKYYCSSCHHLIPYVPSQIIRGLRDSGIISSSTSVSPSSGQTPNHCLLNEYVDGQGIDKHNDGDLYLPFVVILSLQSPGMLMHTTLVTHFSVCDCDNARFSYVMRVTSVVKACHSLCVNAFSSDGI